MKEFIKKLLRFTGYEVTKFPTGFDKKIIDLFKKRDINMILDAGANIGQYSEYLRRIGYKGEIISFEPLEKENKELRTNSKGDKKWNTYKIALGDSDGPGIINIAGNSYSSSILNMNIEHLEGAPESRYISAQNINIRRLDNFIEENSYIKNYNVFLKLDVQGYEKKVILGTEKNLDLIKGLQLELSFDQLYEGETVFSEMVEYLKLKNYYLCLINSEFTNPKDDKLLQVNTVFFKNDFVK